jgi:hypothetical protein
MVLVRVSFPACLLVCVAALLAAPPASAQGIIVDHTSIPLFEQIPDEYLIAAANLRMMFVDRSVGVNINDGLTCLGYPSDEAAPSSCRRFNHIVPQYSSPASEVNWSRPGGYSRANWAYFGWPGAGGPNAELPCGMNPVNWSNKLDCFIRYVDANPTTFDVYSYQNSFLEVDDQSTMASPTNGYFSDRPNQFDIADFEALEARHPGRIFLHHTTSLARATGNQVATDFNNQMREYARSNNKFLLDIADIESHDLSGSPCYDNRDGVPYTAGTASENHPDDGLDIPAICQRYTRESDGGHLGNPDVGKIRVAKAFWILMARVAGWNPDGGSNTAPVADPQSVATSEDNAVGITLTGSDAEGDALAFRVVGQPAHGGVTGTGANVLYTPAANFNGTDSFTFVANDGQVDSAPQTVALTIAPVNDYPIAQADAATTNTDTPVVVPVLSNDTDIDGDALAIASVELPQHGTVANNASDVTYTPNSGFEGSDTFSYTISDGQGGSASAAVTVTVTPTSTDPSYALRFDGASDFVRLPQTSMVMAPGWQSTKTVGLWVKPTGASFCGAQGPPTCDGIFGDRPRSWGISRGTYNGFERIWVWNWDGTLQAIGFDYVPGEWVHVALVHGGGRLSAYKNGVLVASVPSGPTYQPSIGILHVGGIINSSSRNWTLAGDIDDVQIWNTARSAAEIGEDMNRQLTGSEPGLAAYYRMSDGAGASLTDDSGHGWTGTLQDGGQGVPADGPITWIPSR